MCSNHAKAIDAMPVDQKDTEFYEVTGGGGKLYLATDTSNFISCTFNDYTPSIATYFYVVQNYPFKLIEMLLDKLVDFESWSDEQKRELKITCQNQVDDYDYDYDYDEKSKKIKATARLKKYKKVKADIDIAFSVLIYMQFNSEYPTVHEIPYLAYRILPLHLRFPKNVTITMRDAITFLENDKKNKLVVLDLPYFGSWYNSGITNFDYKTFHIKVATYLENAEYPWIYYCRSTPSSEMLKAFNGDYDRALNAMFNMLYEHFYRKGYFFSLVCLPIKNKVEVEVIITNRLLCDKKYTNKQFQWEETYTLLNETKKAINEFKLSTKKQKT